MKRSISITAWAFLAIAVAMVPFLAQDDPVPARSYALLERRVDGSFTRKRGESVTKAHTRRRTGEPFAVSALAIGTSDGTTSEALERLRGDSMRKLDRLTKELGLSETQRMLILPSLVAAAHPSVPGITVFGKPVERTSGASIEDAVCDVLDEEQQAIYQNMLLDDAAWWDDAIAQLSSQDETDDPESPDPSGP